MAEHFRANQFRHAARRTLAGVVCPILCQNLKSVETDVPVRGSVWDARHHSALQLHVRAKQVIKSVKDDPVYQLLSVESQVVFQIPKYQREYSWTRGEWEMLFDDLMESESSHFLGTIICINATTNSTDKVILELVDGQQRMTTISLLMAAVFSLLKENRASLSEDGLLEMANLRRRLVMKTSGEPRLRLQSQGNNHDDYLHTLTRAGVDIEAKQPSWYGLRRIAKCFDYFRSRIESEAIEQQVTTESMCHSVRERIERAVLVKLEVDSHADAFVLFESLNNRGMPLTPIDLIKNSLLAAADKSTDQRLTVDSAFMRWNELLEDLGDDYAVQDRFFRQYYNAFRSELPPVPNAPMATRSTLIRIYETFIKEDLDGMLTKIQAAGESYQRIIGRNESTSDITPYDLALLHLSRAQGTPSYILLLRLMSRAEPLSGNDLTEIAQLLTSFFVRRNLTGVPQTHALPRLFMDLAEETADVSGEVVASHVRTRLQRVSAPDSEFARRLRGPLYQENTDLTRFILTSLAEDAMTQETTVDLWLRSSDRQYRWTIEHVMPQGRPLPETWVDTLGGPDEASRLQDELVHTLGNLTISGYNSHLGNKSFDEKRDRRDGKGRFIGYRNGLSLNEDIVNEPAWGAEQIRKRTDRLVRAVVDRFPL